MIYSTLSCMFCQKTFQKQGTKEYFELYGLNQVLGEYKIPREHFKIIILHDINAFPQNGAHILFVPFGKANNAYHPISFAQTHLNEKCMLGLISKWAKILFDMYPKQNIAILAEHGMGFLQQKNTIVQVRCGSCGIEHAHLHLFLDSITRHTLFELRTSTESLGLQRVTSKKLFPCLEDTKDKPYFYIGFVKKI